MKYVQLFEEHLDKSYKLSLVYEEGYIRAIWISPYREEGPGKNIIDSSDTDVTLITYEQDVPGYCKDRYPGMDMSWCWIWIPPTKVRELATFIGGCMSVKIKPGFSFTLHPEYTKRVITFS